MLALIGRWFDLIPTSTTQDMVKILNIGQQGRALSEALEIQLSSLLCSELGSDVNIKVVDMDMSFYVDLE